MPTVSVIIPTYQRANVLERAMDSVLDQTLEDLELIVADDGSTDGTKDVVESYDDPRVRYVAHETNRGASVARNTGLEHATGKYVAYLDSDDVFLPEKLEKQVSTLEGRSEDWVAAYCGAKTVFDDRKRRLRRLAVELVSRRRDTEGMEGGEELIGAVLANELHTSAGSTLLVEREVAERIGGFQGSWEWFQDPEFLIRILEQGKLAYVDEDLIRRYVSSDPPADTIKSADQRYLERFEDHVERFEARGWEIRGAHDYLLAKHFLEQGEFREGARHLTKAKRPEPIQLPGLIQSVTRGARTKLYRFVKRPFRTTQAL